MKAAIFKGKEQIELGDLEQVADAYAAMDERRAIKSLLKVSEL
jgi:hypothetical protein